jgi:hypothetical protein
MSGRIRLVILPAMSLLLVVGWLAGCSNDPPAPPVIPPASESASPTPTSSATKAPSKKVKPARATFKHFKVTVSEVKRHSANQVRIKAKVCVRSLPPDPQGNRTRISRDPWAVRAGGQTIKASGATFAGDFPSASNATFRVGECASGWVPFATADHVTRVKYTNGVGNVAVWSGDHLDRKPETRTVQPRTPTKSVPPRTSSRTVTPGAYCEPRGATGVTRAGTAMVCKSKIGDRPRWRKR